MSELVIDSLQSARQLNLERGIRLARIVGRAFIPAIVLSWVALLFSPLPLSQGIILTGGSLCAIGFLVVGVWLAEHQQAEWAARSIITGIQLATTAFQVIWASSHGIDGIVLVLFLAQTIPIGLASALSGAALLRNTFVVTLLLIATIFVSGTLWFHPALSPSLALAEGLMTAFFTGTIAALLYGAGVYYAQALQNLGTIRIAYERAQRLDDLKDQFIMHVNHELRTPIMTLQGTIEFLQAARHTMNDEQEIRLFAQACRNADRLVALLASVLDVRKIEQDSTTVQFEQVPLAAAIAQAHEVVDPQGTRLFHIVVAPQVAVWADPHLLQQILVNLLSNAIKYSPSDAPVEIRVNVFPEIGMPVTVQMHIRDYGLGIAAELIPLLFHRFVRLPRDMASSISGSGVGLYLSKVLTQAMGGRIWVESSGVAGEGADFIVEFSSMESAMTVTAPHTPSRPSKRKK